MQKIENKFEHLMKVNQGGMKTLKVQKVHQANLLMTIGVLTSHVLHIRIQSLITPSYILQYYWASSPSTCPSGCNKRQSSITSPAGMDYLLSVTSYTPLNIFVNLVHIQTP